MKKIIKFSKSYNNILKLKKDFFIENNKNFKNANLLNRIYLQGPKRKKCKNCNSNASRYFLKSFNVRYFLCNKCGHVNGEKQETNAFFKKLYLSGSGSKNIVKNYKKSYHDRVKNIYKDKVQFLKKVVKEKLKILDIGSGAGHFLKALENNGISAVGYEPNQSLANIGNKFLIKNKLININFSDLENLMISHDECNCVSAIGVLEHLENPNKFLKLFKRTNARYLYLSIPLFSLSCFIENAFKNIYPRHLSGGHTHLYTKESIYFFAKKYKLKIIGEWWFGLDIPDLYRSIVVSSNILDKKIYNSLISKKFYNVINSMQNSLDRKKISSEVHIIFKKIK